MFHREKHTKKQNNGKTCDNKKIHDEERNTVMAMAMAKV